MEPADSTHDELADALAELKEARRRIAELEVQLRHAFAAMEHRAAIEQAKGIIMSVSQCSPDTAFEILRAQSQAENRKLHEIADELVARQEHT